MKKMWSVAKVRDLLQGARAAQNYEFSCMHVQLVPSRTHNEILKKRTLFFAFINRIMMESQLRIANPMRMLSVVRSHLP